MNIKLIKRIVLLLVVVFGIYQIGYALVIDSKTGTLVVKSSNNANISITGKNLETVSLGITQIKAKINPGQYTILATKDSIQTSKYIIIAKNQTTNISLDVDSLINAHNNFVNKLKLQNKFINSLPFEGPMAQYRINYVYSYQGQYAQPIIVISGPNQDAWNMAILFMKDLGYDPSIFTIRYVTQTYQHANYTNGRP